MVYANDEDRRHKALKAALDLVEYVCQQRMAMALLDPTPDICQIGAEAAGIAEDQARRAYWAMIEAQR